MSKQREGIFSIKICQSKFGNKNLPLKAEVGKQEEEMSKQREKKIYRNMSIKCVYKIWQ